jgi:CheY-like chemotaxis protein
MIDRKEIINKYMNLETLNDVYRLDLGDDYDVNKPTILIVDDFEAIVTLFKRLIKRLDITDEFNVIYATGHHAALKVVNEIYHNESLHIDVIISDITFGSSLDVGDLGNFTMNGIELVGTVFSIYPGLIYHFITGHIVSPKATPQFYKEYSEYADDNLIDHITYKDTPVSTNNELFINLFKGTRYEKSI